MHSYEIKPNLQKILNKLSKKDKNLYEQVLKKISEITDSSDVEHYKNLRYNMMKNTSVVGAFLIFYTVLIAVLLIFSLGSPVLLGQVSSETDPIFSVRILDFQSPVDLGGFLEFFYAFSSIL